VVVDSFVHSDSNPDWCPGDFTFYIRTTTIGATHVPRRQIAQTTVWSLVFFGAADAFEINLFHSEVNSPLVPLHFSS
jgi:hypothetical protein